MYKTIRDNQNRQKKRATILAFLTSVILFFAKFYAYRISYSQAILSDALESVINIASAIMTFIVITVVTRPKNEKYPYGPGKLESFASGAEGGAITVAGMLIVIEGINALISKITLTKITESIFIIIIAGIINGFVGLRLFIIGKRTHSISLKSAGIHLLADFWTSFGVIIGLLITKLTGYLWADPVVAILIGIQLSWSGFKILKKSFSDLLDTQDINLIKQIGLIFDKNMFSGIIRIHFTRVIRSGVHHHIDAHAIVPDFWSTKEAHMQTKNFEETFLKDYKKDGELHLHLDPCLQLYCVICDYTNCPIRKNEYQGKKPPHTIDELINPTPTFFK